MDTAQNPEYRVVITRRASGVEKRNRAWAYPLVKVTATLGPRAENEIQEALEMWHAAGGSARGFRFRDKVDCLSCRRGQTPLVTDQPLIETDVAGVYQLMKLYQWGIDENGDPVMQYRPIYKPVVNLIQLSSGGTVDYTTGLVTGGSGGTWGGEFDIPVRFEPSFPIKIVNLRIESVTFALQELRITRVTEETG